MKSSKVAELNGRYDRYRGQGIDGFLHWI